MKSVLMIGLGQYGRNMIEKLNELNYEVMAVDKEEARVNEALPLVTDAQIGDATNEAFLETLGVDNYDVCFVTIGSDFQSSLVATSLLKDLGATRKALIVLPERDENVVRAAANIPGVKTAYVNTLNVLDILNYDKFIVTQEAVKLVEEVYD